MEEITDLHRLLGVNSIQEARELSDDEVERRINRPEALGAYLPMQAMDGYVFTDDFDTLCTNHQYHDVDILIGFTKDESFMYVYPEDQELFIQGIQQEYGDLANQYLSYCDFLEDEISFKKHLFSRNAELLKTSAILLAEDIEEGSTNNAYMYCFTRDLNDGFGAYHSCELWYEFQTLNRSCREFKGIDYELSKTMTKYWINFAKTGNPNGKGLPQWTPYTKEHPTMMELGEHVGMKNFGENERVKFRKEFLRKNTIKKW